MRYRRAVQKSWYVFSTLDSISTLDSSPTDGVDVLLGYILVLGKTNSTLGVRFRMCM